MIIGKDNLLKETLGSFPELFKDYFNDMPGSENEGFIPDALLKKIRRVIITGNGDSYAVSLAAESLGRRVFPDHYALRSLDVSRHFVFPEDDAENTLVIVISVSGNGARAAERHNNILNKQQGGFWKSTWHALKTTPKKIAQGWRVGGRLADRAGKTGLSKIWSQFKGSLTGIGKRMPLIFSLMVVLPELPNIFSAFKDKGLVGGVAETGKIVAQDVGYTLVGGVAGGLLALNWLGLEAAIAYYQATGKSRFLDIIRKYVDYIDQTFGPDEGKIHGYPGHQEIELALVKLYQLTGVERYLNLAKYFIDARGTKPLFFEQEALKQGRDLNYGGPKGILGKDFLAPGPYALFQSHLPVREQKSAEGHAVRVVYMGTAMVDVAMESGDESLLNAAETLWDNITERRMAITGGVGAKDQSERFAYDYYLPNEICYNETCASIGLAMWAYRFLQYSADTKYADILEKALYNGIISGVSLSGDRFFYANHLASDPDMFKDRIITNPRMLPERQSWFAVSCCPMNLARITESIGGYMYTASDDTIFCHIYASGIARINGHVIEQKTEYPWNGNIVIEPDSGNYTIALRIPGWCDSFSIKVNGNDADYSMKKGYAYIRNNWTGSDSITLNLCMRPFLVEANPLVRMDAGKVAIQYGPLIYCIEEADNGSQVFDLFLSRECSLITHFEEDLLGGVVVVEGEGYVHDLTKWQHKLYSKASSNTSFERKKFRAIPYYAWANRGNGKMTVWLNSLQTERK